MMPDELKNLPKGQFVVMKTGAHPMRTRLRLFLDWGISFGDPYLMPEKAARSVAYADKPSLMRSITATNPRRNEDAASAPSAKSGGMQDTDGPTQAFEADESMQELEQRHGQQKPYNTRRHREQERQP